MRDFLACNPLSQRLRFGWNLSNSGFRSFKGLHKDISPWLFIAAVVGVSAAGVATDHRYLALYVLVACLGFEGAYRIWRAERTRANELEDDLRELGRERHSKLYRQCNEVNGLLMSAKRLRQRAMQDSTSAHINAVASEIDGWVGSTAEILQAHDLDSGPFVAVTGDYGSGVFKVDERLEAQRAMRERQLRRLDAHIAELKKIHDRVTEMKASSYRKLYGET